MNSFFVINPRKSILQIIHVTDLCVELSPDIVVYLSGFAKVFFLHQKQASEYIVSISLWDRHLTYALKSANSHVSAWFRYFAPKTVN